MQTDAGKSPDQICALTLDEVEELFVYWKSYPPLRDLVAAFIGFKPKGEDKPDASKYVNADDLRRIMAMTGGKVAGLRQS